LWTFSLDDHADTTRQACTEHSQPTASINQAAGLPCCSLDDVRSGLCCRRNRGDGRTKRKGSGSSVLRLPWCRGDACGEQGRPAQGTDSDQKAISHPFPLTRISMPYFPPNATGQQEGSMEQQQEQ